MNEFRNMGNPINWDEYKELLGETIRPAGGIYNAMRKESANNRKRVDA